MAMTPVEKLLSILRKPDDSIWLDGRLVTFQTQYTISDISYLTPNRTLVLPANPSRIAAGFFVNSLLVGPTNVAPWPDVDQYPFNGTGGFTALWYTLSEYPGIIGNAWYVHGLNDGPLRVVEVTKQQRG